MPSTTARRWELAAPGQLILGDAPLPAVGPHEVLVGVRVSAVSPGTDLHMFRTGPTPAGSCLGYLCVGEVLERGGEVTDVRVGDTVFAPLPHGSHGIVDADRVVAVPAGVAPEPAALAYLASLGLHCLHEAGYRAGEDVYVIGQGLVGACAALVARHAGARVRVWDTDPVRARLARERGMTVGAPGDAAAAPDVIIETTGAWPGLATAAQLAGTGTRLAILGIYRSVVPAEVAEELHRHLNTFPSLFHYGHLRLIGCSSFPWRARDPHATWTVQRALGYLFEAVHAGRLPIGDLITHRYDAGRLAEVMGQLDRGERSMLGVTLRWDS